MHFRLNKQVHHASYNQPGAPVNLRYIEKYNQYPKEKIFPIILFLQLKFLLITTESLIFYRPPGACKKKSYVPVSNFLVITTKTVQP